MHHRVMFFTLTLVIIFLIYPTHTYSQRNKPLQLEAEKKRGFIGLTSVGITLSGPSNDLEKAMRLTPSIQNLTDNKHQEIRGAPEIGRLAILRLMQTFYLVAPPHAPVGLASIYWRAPSCTV